jgi:hypothetical protein
MTALDNRFECFASQFRYDFAVVIRRYGFWGFDLNNLGTPISNRFILFHAASMPRDALCEDIFSIVIVDKADIEPLPGVEIKSELPGNFLYANRRRFLFSDQAPVFKPLRPYVSFSGESITPIWTTKSGRTVVGWWNRNGINHLIVGLSVVDEIVRYTQGDPQKVYTAKDKTLWGVGHERPAYLFEDHVVPGFELEPWADRLGYCLARSLAVGCNWPLICPLPRGAKGGILLTGDDDQAFLEKYEEQAGLLGGFPITYMLLPHTKHTPESLSRIPGAVEFGVHIDALPDPANYGSICVQQTESVRKMVNSPVKSVRNHGHLNSGYWGHLESWERCDLRLDLNVRGWDGTCPTGSYLPFRVRRPDGTWSRHLSLFSTFSDSMLYLQKWPQKKQIKCIKKLRNLIESSNPGVIVINLHPQNVSDFYDVHRAVVKLGRRKNWMALGAESYIDWLIVMDDVLLSDVDGNVELKSISPVENLAYYWPSEREENIRVLPVWTGSVVLPRQ